MWILINKKMNAYFEADLTVEETKEILLMGVFMGVFLLLLAFNLPLGWWWGSKHWINIR